MKGILLDTDIIFEHLIGTEGVSAEYSLLELLLSREVCFTTVLNAAELFYHCENSGEKEFVRQLLNGLNILGVHPRYALELEKPDAINSADTLRALFFATAVANKMKIATLHPEYYPAENKRFVNLHELVSGEKL